MSLISGIGDFCQVYVTYRVDPRSSLIVFTFKIANMTGFLIENLAVSFQCSQNLQVRPNQSAAQTLIGKRDEQMDDDFGAYMGPSDALSTKECIEWNVTAALLSLDQTPKIMLRLSLQASESCPEHILSYELDTIPFSVSLADLLIPDRSLSISEEGGSHKLSPFHFLFNSLPYSLCRKCFTTAASQTAPSDSSRTMNTLATAMQIKLKKAKGGPPFLFLQVSERLKDNMQLCILNSHRLAMLGATWDGHRLAL